MSTRRFTQTAFARTLLRFSGLMVLLFAVSTNAEAQSTLIPTGSVWRYQAEGTPPTDGWRGLWFDDSAWLSGPAKLGYGEGDEATVIANPPDAPITAYFRHSFIVTNRIGISTLTLRLRRDDGAVVYLNSNEVYRSNLPAGPILHHTTATNTVSGAAEAEFTQRALPASFLANGTNVLAVELHQHATSREDAGFDAELIAGIPNSYPSVALSSPADGSTQSVGAMRFTASAADVDGHIFRVTFHAGTSLPQAETNIIASRLEPPYEYTWPGVPTGRYFVSAQATDNSGRSTRSPWAHVQVGSVGNATLQRGPYLQSGSTTGMVVRWRTDWFVPSRVRYGTNAANLDQTILDPTPHIDHAVRIHGLLPDTKYFYRVGTDLADLVSGTSYFFRTSPTNDKPVRIWVIGDSGTAQHTPYAEAVRDAYLDATGGIQDLWLMLGDNAYESGTDAQYQSSVFEMYPTVLRNTVVWPTLGNHDASSNGDFSEFPYLDIFTLPKNGEAGGVSSGTEKYYSFDHANIHFICLDATSSDRSQAGAMLTWLENDLASTDRDWIVAFWHHPPYTFGTHNSDFEIELIEMRQNALPILERYGVDLVLCGHSHVYERSYLLNGHYGFASSFSSAMLVQPGTGRENLDGAYTKPAGGLGANRGTVYAVCGCSGEGGSFAFPRHPAMARNLSGFGSMILQFNKLRLDARFVNHEGGVDDYFTIRKDEFAEDVRPEVTIRRAGAEVKLAWPTSLLPFRLEEATELKPSSHWAPVPGAPQTVGREHSVLLPRTGTNRVFRLRAEGD